MVTGHGVFPVYVDSPLANEATSIYMQCSTDCFDEDIKAVMERGENPLVFPGLHTYVTDEESKYLNVDQKPKVIISASGMCEAGRVCHHLKYNLWRRECTILFVGYQAKGTVGRRIFDGAESVKLFGDEIAVNAHIESLIGISGHADREGLLKFVESMENKPSQVFVNHGEDTSAVEFAQTLERKFSLKAMAPFSGTSYDLLKGEFTEITEGVPVKVKENAQESFSRNRLSYNKLTQAANRLNNLVEKSRGIPNKELERFAKALNALCEKYQK